MISTVPSLSEGHVESHLVQDKAAESISYTSIQQLAFRVTSALCTTVFLLVLFICALIQNLFDSFKNLNRKNRSLHVGKVYSPEELRLVPDVSYYFGLFNLHVNKYEIITEDGFVICAHRMIDPYESIHSRRKRKPVLLLHGLLQSSGSFCSSGKDSLAFMLFKSGYDVWLGNNRCGFEPRHINYSPNDFQMWDWDILDMAKYDLTAMIDHVLSNTDCETTKLALVCHSQGTTQGFINLDNDRFGNSSKISCFVALSPAVYGGSLIDEKRFIKVIAKMTLNNYFFGIWEFMPLMLTMRKMLVKYRIFGYLSYLMFNYLFDWNDKLWDRTIRNRHFLFSPVFVSVKLMSWWLNDKTGFKTSKAVLQDNSTWFNDSTPMVFLVVPQKDKLVDGAALINHLRNYENPAKYSYIQLPDYSHLDVLWSRTVVKDVGKPILDFFEKCNY